MNWHNSKELERPKHLDYCLCILNRNKGIISTYYDQYNDCFVTQDDYGDKYYCNKIKAWITFSEILEDYRKSQK